MVVATAAAGLLLGFVLGLVSFKVKSRWCPECGANTVPTDQRKPVDLDEVLFRKTAITAIGMLWTLGAIGPTLAALHDVLDAAHRHAEEAAA
jgi:hypothetical protein